MKTGILLINLGTPDSPQPQDVRRYLAEFLMDPWVLDIPTFFRFLLVYGLILPTRPKKVSKQYQSIWTDRGSPLLFHTVDLAVEIQKRLGDDFHVLPAMRYGEPSIRSTLKTLKERNVDRVVCVPLYPQYSLAATESSRREVQWELRENLGQTPLKLTGDFYNDPLFIEAWKQRTQPYLESFRPDHVLFSFHGIPERHVKKLHPEHCLMKAECCENIAGHNPQCYRAQCYESAHRIARALQLQPARYSIAFQSRLGRTPWIEPHTDKRIAAFPTEGIRRLLVVEPSFVADCLETLEEICVRGRASFLEAGGEAIELVPSLNSEAPWVDCVANLIQRRLEDERLDNLE